MMGGGGRLSVVQCGCAAVAAILWLPILAALQSANKRVEDEFSLSVVVVVVVERKSRVLLEEVEDEDEVLFIVVSGLWWSRC